MKRNANNSRPRRRKEKKKKQRRKPSRRLLWRKPLLWPHLLFKGNRRMWKNSQNPPQRSKNTNCSSAPLPRILMPQSLVLIQAPGGRNLVRMPQAQLQIQPLQVQVYQPHHRLWHSSLLPPTPLDIPPK